MQPQRMVVFEGPAGSGKTTLLNALMASRPQLLARPAVLPDFERPRAYVGREGRLLSQLKDFRTTLAIVSHEDTTAVLVDRWYVSQWVYGSIRNGRKRLVDQEGRRLLKAAFYTARAAIVEKAAREFSPEVPPTQILSTLFLFAIPDLATLQWLRSGPQKQGRQYPYDPAIEIALYQDAAAKLSHAATVFEETGVSVSVAVLQTSSPEAMATLATRAADVVTEWFYANSTPISQLQTVSPVS
jgi:hypothetical protein